MQLLLVHVLDLHALLIIYALAGEHQHLAG